MRTQSHIEMAQLKLVRSSFAINTDHQSADERIAIGASLKNNGEFFDDGRRAHFLLQFKTADPLSSPFFLEVEFGALFFLDPAPLPLERTYYVRKVFPRLVFPYLREYVAETTRRGGFSPMLLSHNLFEDDPLDDGEPAGAPGEDKWLH